VGIKCYKRYVIYTQKANPKNHKKMGLKHWYMVTIFTSPFYNMNKIVYETILLRSQIYIIKLMIIIILVDITCILVSLWKMSMYFYTILLYFI